jgi:hypothetical protein
MAHYRHRVADALQWLLHFWSSGVWLTFPPVFVDPATKEKAAEWRLHPEFCSLGVGSTMGNRNDSTGIIAYRVCQRGNLQEIYLRAGAARSPIDETGEASDHNSSGGTGLRCLAVGVAGERRSTGSRFHSVYPGWHQHSNFLLLLEAAPEVRCG